MTAVTGHGDRLDYLFDAASTLWPGAAVTVTRGRTAAVGGSFLLLPNANRPRLLVPAGSRRAAASAVLGYGESSSATDRLRTRVLAAGLRSGTAQRMLRDRVHVPAGAPTLADHLGAVLGTELLVGLYLSAPRANRKPVLQLLDPTGRRLGFAKVGVDPLTRRLVRTETAALHKLAAAALPGLITPQVMHSGRWNELELLVQSALPLGTRRRPVQESVLAEVMRRVSAMDIGVPAELGRTAFWQDIRARVAVLPDGAASAGLTAVLAGLYDVAGRKLIATGSWHGDWTPWNMAALRGGLAVWDWERFAAGRPVGFDPLHHALQRDLVARRSDAALAVERCVDGAPALLAPLGVRAMTATITACCYLAELAIRYTEDRQAEAGARLGRVQDWLIPGLRARIEGWRQ